MIEQYKYIFTENNYEKRHQEDQRRFACGGTYGNYALFKRLHGKFK
jgi:hypothetical protein